MAAIGKLVVTLTARTGRFRKGLAKARARVTSFAAGIGSAAKRAAKFGAIVTGIAVAALAVFTKKAFGTIDATAKLARQIGISIDGLRGLARAAEITGAGQAALEKGLGFLTKALGEAETGIGEGKQALEALALSSSDLVAIPLDEAVGIIADRMNNLATQSDKAFVASKLFGRGGLALINTLALGSKGLEEMAAGSIRLQGSLSAFDAAKVEDANDAISDLRATFTGFFERIAVTTAPLVKSLAKRLTQTLIFFRENAATVVPRVLNFFKSILSGAVVLAEGIKENVKRIPIFFQISAIEAVLIFETMRNKMLTIFKTLITDIKGAVDFIPTFFSVASLKSVELILDTFNTINKARTDFAAGLAEGLGLEKIGARIRATAKQTSFALGLVAKIAATAADAEWGQFLDRTGKRGEVLRVQIEEINKEFEAIREVLVRKQAGLLGPDGGDPGGFLTKFAKLIADIKAIELPATALAEAAGVAGSKIGDEIRKATGLRPAAAIERGTIQAFSANVRSIFSSLANSGKRTVDKLTETNGLLRRGNEIMADRIDIVTVDIA